MSQVSVTINGRQFRMACEDGQEGHLMELARDLDTRIEGLRSKFGEIGDTRLTVMAALTIADVLSENAQRIKRLEDEVAVLADARATAAVRKNLVADDGDIGLDVERIAGARSADRGVGDQRRSDSRRAARELARVGGVSTGVGIRIAREEHDRDLIAG